MNSAQTSCLGCYKSFATDNLPRNAKCAHTYCERCLKTLTECVIDRHPIDNTLPISSFPINMAVAKSITRSHNQSVNSSYANKNSSYQSVNSSNSFPTLNNQKPIYQQSYQSFQSIESPIASNPIPSYLNYPQISITPLITNFSSEPLIESTLTIASNPQKQLKQICKLHNKEIDLICLDDGVAICSNCALFGDHKLHNIKTIESCSQQCTKLGKKALNILSDIKIAQSSISVRAIEDKIDFSCRQKKIKLSSDIKTFYQKILSKVIAAQKQSYQQLDRMIESEKTQLKNQFVNSQKQKNKLQWIEEANKFIKQVGSVNIGQKNIEKLCKFLTKSENDDSFLKQGQYILVQLNSLSKLSQQKVNHCFNNIVISKQNLELQKLIKEGCKIYKQQDDLIQSKWGSPQKGDEDFLLEQLAASNSSQRINTFSDSNTNEFNQPFFHQIQSRLTTQINLLSQDRQQIKQPKQKIEKEPFGAYNGGQVKKKNKKIKVPEKYNQTLQDLKHDRIQCIDFTNADLGDAGILPIFQLLRGTSKIKTLKLIRNKLTDECLSRLLQCCLQCKVTTINLSQNNFTDRALDVLQNAQYRDLRSITLNQNRINQRNAKPRIQQLKQIGLVILV